MEQEEKLRIEKVFFNRMEYQEIKSHTKKYYLAQTEFFVGAMCALQVTNYAAWSVMIMSSRDIVEYLRK